MKDSQRKAMWAKINNISKGSIIKTNKQVIEDWNKRYKTEKMKFGVRDEVNEVTRIVNNVKITGNEKEVLIRKASLLMASIAWAQPFLDANKRTAYITANDFLNKYGYDLPLKTKTDELELNKLLLHIQDERSRLNPLITKRIIFYTRRNIQKL